MFRGRPVAPRTVVSTGISTLDIPDGQSVAFDVDAFDDLARAHGVELVHWRAMRDPGGLADLHDYRRAEDHLPADGGLIYTKGGIVTCTFTGNSQNSDGAPGGYLNSAQAQVTVPRTYDGSEEPARMHPQDRLYFAEPQILVPEQHLVAASETGRDRLRFDAACVQDLLDSRGVRYTQGDFDVSNGDILWGPKRPAPGQVYAIRYLYRPYWVVDHLIHELRVAQREDMDGGRRVVLLPQCAEVHREYVNRDRGPDPLRGADRRDAPAAPDGPL